ncbi:MAG: GNAT family N-acetyltransferase [Bacteroidota bacterium]
MKDVTVSQVTTSSPEYRQVWELREEILRKPLGMSLKDEDLGRDHVDTIFAASHEGKVIGCLMAHHNSGDEVQLRQMAVYNEWQGKGVGRLLINVAEAYAQSRGYKTIILHARKVAAGFYENLGYTTYGDEFTEVNIPHYMMQKAVVTE